MGEKIGPVSDFVPIKEKEKMFKNKDATEFPAPSVSVSYAHLFSTGTNTLNLYPHTP